MRTSISLPSRRTVFITMRGVSRKIKARVLCDSTRDLIRIKPVKKLKARKVYRAITTKVRDLAGNRFDGKTARAGFQNHRWIFTTRR